VQESVIGFRRLVVAFDEDLYSTVSDRKAHVSKFGKKGGHVMKMVFKRQRARTQQHC
jgi:hypothetical protein